VTFKRMKRPGLPVIVAGSVAFTAWNTPSSVRICSVTPALVQGSGMTPQTSTSYETSVGGLRRV
jgi:hypothetical protein